ncbi:MAG: hypothetical protein ACM3OC_07915 [Deltaproteobacteria bacterium]
MKEIVSRILQEEENARKQVEKARQDSVALVTRARQQAAITIENAVSDAKSDVQKQKDEAFKAQQAEKEKMLAEARSQTAAQREKKSKDIPRFAQQYFSEVIDIKI